MVMRSPWLREHVPRAVIRLRTPPPPPPWCPFFGRLSVAAQIQRVFAKVPLPVMAPENFS